MILVSRRSQTAQNGTEFILHRLRPADKTWWRKPLARVGRRALPAELVVLARELRPGERGVWMNSRGTTSGVVDLVCRDDHYETKRAKLPDFVTSALKAVYARGDLRKGCPDLVIWRDGTERLRLVEVKCPEWDHLGPDQTQFMAVAKGRGIPSKVVEWRFVRERRLT